LVADGVRWTTKIVLFPVRFLFTAETGREGTNDAAARHYLAHEHGANAALVAAALRWRAEPPAKDEAVGALRRGLVPLYLHYVEDHIQRLESHHETELALAFREWRSRLTAA
jgi:hypothetical protein